MRAYFIVWSNLFGRKNELGFCRIPYPVLIWGRKVELPIRRLAERPWEGRPKKVKVLYAKTDLTRNCILSTTGHVKSDGNLPRPLGKAKYSLMTDSEPVPRGKGEKYPWWGVKSTWNRVFTTLLKHYIYYLRVLEMCDSVPVEEWSGELMSAARLTRMGEPQRKRVLKGRQVAFIRPESKWSIPGQDETSVKRGGGPKCWVLKNSYMSWG